MAFGVRGVAKMVVVVVVKVVVVVVVKVVLLWVWFKIMIEKKNGYFKESQPDKSHQFPLNNGGDLTEQKLTGITELGTFMVYCKFPQP